VTQCLVTFDGQIGVDRMRQLVEERLLIDGPSTANGSYYYLVIVLLLSVNQSFAMGWEMSTSQSAVMVCGWGVQAGITHDISRES